MTAATRFDVCLNADCQKAAESSKNHDCSLMKNLMETVYIFFIFHICNLRGCDTAKKNEVKKQSLGYLLIVD